MSPAGRNRFVAAQDGNIHRAAKALAQRISHKKMRVEAMACIQEVAKDRPLVNDVYLHLTSTVAIKDGLGLQATKNMDVVQREQVDKTLSN